MNKNPIFSIFTVKKRMKVITTKLLTFLLLMRKSYVTRTLTRKFLQKKKRKRKEVDLMILILVSPLCFCKTDYLRKYKKDSKKKHPKKPSTMRFGFLYL